MAKKSRIPIPTPKGTALRTTGTDFRTVWRYMVLTLVVLAPFNQGFYWPLDKMVFGLISIALALVWLLVKPRAVGVTWSVAHTALVVLLALYAIGLVTPASVNGALRGLVMWAGLFALYWLVSDIGFTETERHELIAALVLSGALLSFMGVAAHSGVYDAPNQLVRGRVAAGFQYSNATASWLMICFLVTLVYGFQEERPRWRMFWTTTAMISLPAFLLTVSRGGYLAMLVGGAMVVLLFRRQFLEVVSYTAIIATIGVIGTALLVVAPGLISLLALPILALLGAAVECKLLRHYWRAVGFVAIGGVTLALLVVGAVVLGVVDAPGVLPADLAAEFSRLTRGDLLEDLRFVFISDGLRAVRASPLLGYGGGAWNAVYPRYQTYFYGAGRAHSDPLDIVLETGLMGLLAYLLFVAINLRQSWRHPGIRSAPSILVVAVAALFHSLGEALLAFPAVYALLFALWASLPSPVSTRPLTRPVRYVAITIAVAVIVLAGALSLTELELARLPALTASGQSDEAMATLNRALLLNPWHADARHALHEQLAVRADQSAAERANLERLSAAEPFDPRVTNALGHWYAARGDHTEALRYYELSIERQPRNVQNLETLVLASSSAAIEILSRQGSGWEAFRDRVFQVHKVFTATRARIPARFLTRGGVHFQFRPAMALALGEAHAISGDHGLAIPYLLTAESSTEMVVAKRGGLMLARLYEHMNKPEQAAALVARHATTQSWQYYLARLRLIDIGE